MIGLNINGYKIQEFVGKGSFGTVYKCEKNAHPFALKIFNLDYVYNEFKTHGEDNRVTREIEVLKKVTHKNVIHYIDDGVFENNKQEYVYVVMEYIEGGDLNDFISSYNLPVDQVIDIFKQILEGLDAIHSKEIVHRDLKPKNIFITNDFKIKVLDFGLSKLIDFTSITSTGDHVGSPLYMSPEQVRDSKNIDYRSDYYALGVVLFELLTKTHPYGEIVSREQLFYKIINEPPMSILHFDPTVPNNIDNLIVKLLDKSNYKRPNSIEEIKESLCFNELGEEGRIIEFVPNFFLRVWNEKTVLTQFYSDGFNVENIIFPINHQLQQKNLLALVKKNNINYFIDPSTMRLAYDTFADVKGLVALPYAPQGYKRLELDDLVELNNKKSYVKLVIDEQVKHNPDYITSPFHVSNNSNLVTIKNDNKESWFTIDIKLLKEAREYMTLNNINKPLIGGFCIRADILSAKTEREYFLNILSGLPCDAYWVYVDCIDYNSNISQLYNYLTTLLDLQKSTQKPVIAGRIGTVGLLLLAFGLYGFESGSARFESFYEDLFKDDSENYNMYVMYYIPELLRNVSVHRRDPSKIISILKARYGIDLKCDCPYCHNKSPEEFLIEANTKKHFLHRRIHEVRMMQSMDVSTRVDYMTERVDRAIEYYKSLAPIFKDSDFGYLRNWQKLIPDLRKEFGV